MFITNKKWQECKDIFEQIRAANVPSSAEPCLGKDTMDFKSDNEQHFYGKC